MREHTKEDIKPPLLVRTATLASVLEPAFWPTRGLPKLNLILTAQSTSYNDGQPTILSIVYTLCAIVKLLLRREGQLSSLN